MQNNDLATTIGNLANNGSLSLPLDIAEYITSQPYWEKDLDYLLYRGSIPFDENVVSTTDQTIARGCIVKIKSNETGFFINDILIVEWASQHVVKDGDFGFYDKEKAIIFEEGGKSISLKSKDVSFSLNEINSDEILYDFKKCKAKIIAHLASWYLKDSLWEKWNLVGITRNSARSKGASLNEIAKVQLYADKTGLYKGDRKKLLLDWEKNVVFGIDNESMLLVNEKDLIKYFVEGFDSIVVHSISRTNYCCTNNPQNHQLYYSFNKKVLGTWGDLEIEDYKPKQLSGSIDSGSVRFSMDAQDKGIQSLTCTFGLTYEQTKTQSSLIHFDYSVGTLFSSSAEDRSTRFYFYQYSIYIELSHGDSIVLRNPLSHEEKEEDRVFIEAAGYKLSRIDLRRIINSEKIIITLNSNGNSWSFDLSQNKALFSDFEQYVFSSPDHLLAYYDALIAFEHHRYLKANELISAAITQNPRNCFYKELKEEIKGHIDQMIETDVKDIENLINKKQYKEAITKADKEAKLCKSPLY